MIKEKEYEYVLVPQDDIDVWKCNECPKFEYESGKDICCKLDDEVEDANIIDSRCPYRKKKKSNKRKKK
jgi:hypothetical protein